MLKYYSPISCRSFYKVQRGLSFAHTSASCSDNGSYLSPLFAYFARHASIRDKYHWLCNASATPLRMLLRIAALCGVYQYTAVPAIRSKFEGSSHTIAYLARR